MIAVDISRDTTHDELIEIKRSLGIVGFELELRDGIFIARAKSVPVHVAVTEGVLLAIGCGTEAFEAIQRSISKYARRAMTSGSVVVS